MKAFNNILVQVHGDGNDYVLDCATQIAKENKAKLTVVDIVPVMPWPVRFMTSGIEHAIEQISHAKWQRLHEMERGIKDQGLEADCQVVNGPSSTAILRLVERGAYDLVIRRPKGKKSRLAGFFGTTAMRLMRKCTCPILFPRPRESWAFERVAAAVKITTDSDVHAQLNHRILTLAQRLAEPSKSLDVIAAWSLYWTNVMKSHMREEEYTGLVERDTKRSQEALDTLLKECDMSDVRSHLVCGEAGQVIPQFVEEQDIDLIVMGAMGRSGLAGLVVGNTAEQVMSKTRSSVLAIHPNDKASLARTTSAVYTANA